MLAKFRNIFSRNISASESEDIDVELAEYANPNFITEPAKISKLLNEIEAASPLCSVKIDGLDQDFSSSLLGINQSRQIVMLDELLPKYGNDLLLECRNAKVMLLHKGIHLSFVVNGMETGFANGIAFYKAPWPQRIYYPQRRRSHRIDVAGLNMPFSGVAQKNRFSVSGYIYDLSASGAGVQMPVNRSGLQRGDTINNCRIHLGDYAMDFDFSIRFVKNSPPGVAKILIGGCFENISPRSLTKLSYFVTSLERVEIRRRRS
ncbi:MAG: flagellar regulator YcgR PilZN domain-containing protein [Methylomonas sp.]|jgi:c-di-GMP-binding flagellar brake protein YcgR